MLEASPGLRPVAVFSRPAARRRRSRTPNIGISTAMWCNVWYSGNAE
jgi:hypothetical protein